MRVLDKKEHLSVLKLYLKQKNHFPLILAVLLNLQDGEIFYDDNKDDFLIIHKYGFAQVLENSKKALWRSSVIDHLQSRTLFPKGKIRLYSLNQEWLNILQKELRNQVEICERVQLRLKSQNTTHPKKLDLFQYKIIDKHNFNIIESTFKFEIATRFWDSKESFLKNSFGFTAFEQEKPVSLCYACAVSNNLAEIDIYTLPEYRGLGLSKTTLLYFIDHCNHKKIVPNWDCYTNNLNSFNLALNVGFSPTNKYAHAIIK